VLQIAAEKRFARPSMCLATGLCASAKLPAICDQVLCANTPGLYPEFKNAYDPPTSTAGVCPNGSNWLMASCSDGVGCWRLCP
jgi:hypothetical protein